MIEIPPKDGTVVRFAREEGTNALLNLMDRLRAGEDVPLSIYCYQQEL
jgi:hypothetical protein